MRKYLILAQSECTANALNAWLELLGETTLPKGDPQRIVWEGKASGGEAAVFAYESLVRRVESAASAEDGAIPLNEVVALVDSARLSDLSVIAEGANWDHLLAMLILSFPEIQWVFGVLLGSAERLREAHTLASLLTAARRDPLLDPTGLRCSVRDQTNSALEVVDDLILTCRVKTAAAIDEERNYAYLNGYTAYRFGYQVDLVTTWASMQELFGKPGDKEPHGYWLLLEDMSLNFADKPNAVHLLRLYECEDKDKEKVRSRGFWCPKLNSTLENSAYRILVTTGQARDNLTLKNNEEYLKKKKNTLPRGNNQEQYGTGTRVFKPARGMFGLWKDAGLQDAPGFMWPPAPTPSKTDNKGHGSPGRLMLVADTLIRRSRSLSGKTSSVETAIHGAVLATDALELTGGRTPTLAMDALTLKHCFEVIAECQFAGVEHHIETKLRLDEIGRDARAISKWFNSEQQENATLNARMHVLNQLVRVFREHNQFDEEQDCMVQVRNLHNTLWVGQKPRWRRFLRPLLLYSEYLLSSFSTFVWILSGWVFVFMLLFWWSGNPRTLGGLGYGLIDAVSGIFSTGPPIQHQGSPGNGEMPLRYAIVVCVAIMAGFFHLGVLVSHLYSLVSRK